MSVPVVRLLESRHSSIGSRHFATLMLSFLNFCSSSIFWSNLMSSQYLDMRSCINRTFLLPNRLSLSTSDILHAGIRRWPQEYLPSIFDAQRVDHVMEISQREAEETMRALAKVEGVQTRVRGSMLGLADFSQLCQNFTFYLIACTFRCCVSEGSEHPIRRQIVSSEK